MTSFERLPDTEIRVLPVKLKAAEKAEVADELTKALDQAAKVEGTKKAVTKRFNAKLEELSEQVADLAGKYRNGTEDRDVECAWEFDKDPDSPTYGKKRLIRLDTKAVVESWQSMTPEDREGRLPLDEAPADPDGDQTGAGGEPEAKADDRPEGTGETAEPDSQAEAA